MVHAARSFSGRTEQIRADSPPPPGGGGGGGGMGKPRQNKSECWKHPSPGGGRPPPPPPPGWETRCKTNWKAGSIHTHTSNQSAIPRKKGLVLTEDHRETSGAIKMGLSLPAKETSRIAGSEEPAEVGGKKKRNGGLWIGPPLHRLLKNASLPPSPRPSLPLSVPPSLPP
jgi:hypothetical protein